MKNGYARKWYTVLIAFIACSLVLSFVSTVFASQEELKSIRHEIWAKGKQWVAAENQISILPDNERKMRLGLLKHLESSAEPAAVAPLVEATLPPASFDWRNYNGENYVTGIRDQGDCGSCWAFAATAALESNVLITAGINSDLAEQILVSCSGAGSCGGGYIEAASDFIRDTGLPPESYYPYKAMNGRCSRAIPGWQNVTSWITSWHYVGDTPNPSLDQIKSELVTYGPLATTFDVYTDFFYYKSGVYTYTSGKREGGHAVLIVGYDDAENCFIVKNSWGDQWGESGYFKIGYSEMDNQIYFGAWSLGYYTDTTVSPSISLESPNGGEGWARNTTQKITWSSSGRPGVYAKIELLNQSGSVVSTITSKTSIAAGYYNWKISPRQAKGEYKIRVTSTASSAYTDTSDNTFTIN